MTQPFDIILPPKLAAIKKALDPIHLAPVECDGITLLVCSALHRHSIPFIRMLGYVESTLTEHIVEPHMWVELDGWIIDYRLRMWVPESVGHQEIIPHGIFSYDAAEDYGFNYQGDPIGFKVLSDSILNFMSDGYYCKLIIPESI